MSAGRHWKTDRSSRRRLPSALVPACLAVVLLLCPPPAAAQRDQFVEALAPFYQALAGTYGDEGAQLRARLETLSAAARRWDRALSVTERELRSRITPGDTRSALEAHTALAALHAERGRFPEALREIDEAIRADPKRAALQRFKAIVLLAAGRPAEAANAFRAAWTLDSSDAQHAYHLVVHRSEQTTPQELERALERLAEVERALARSQPARAETPFITLNSIVDGAGPGIAFAPAAYAPAFSLLFQGGFDERLAALESAVAADPLTAPASRSESMILGSAALRRGAVEEAVAQFQMAVTATPDSSEAHRMLGTAYGVLGDIEKSLQLLREAVRLNPRDERARMAIVQTLDTDGRVDEATTAAGDAVRELPDSGALRWILSVLLGKRNRADAADLDLIATADRLVLVSGKGQLYGRLATLAREHLEYERSIELLERRATLVPNDAGAHRDLGAAYLEQGRDDAAYAELIAALSLDPADAGTLTALGFVHLSAGRYPRTIEVLERAIALRPSNAQALQALGDAYVRSGRTEEGRTRIDEASKLRAAAVEEQRRRRTAGMLATQADQHMQNQQYDRAADAWRQVIEVEGRTSANHLRLAEAYTKAKRLSEAVEELQGAITMKAGPEAHLRLAEAYAALGRPDDSIRARRTYTERKLQELRDRSGDTSPIPPR